MVAKPPIPPDCEIENCPHRLAVLSSIHVIGKEVVDERVIENTLILQLRGKNSVPRISRQRTAKPLLHWSIESLLFSVNNILR